MAFGNEHRPSSSFGMPRFLIALETKDNSPVIIDEDKNSPVIVDEDNNSPDSVLRVCSQCRGREWKDGSDLYFNKLGPFVVDGNKPVISEECPCFYKVEEATHLFVG